MKNQSRRLFALALVMTACLSTSAGSRDALWKAVEDSIQKGLPKSAITNLDSIIPAALSDKAYAEATKAIARKIVLEGTVQGNKPEEKIVRLEAEIAKAPPEMAPMFETLLAHCYWQYFRQNRWRFMQRTATTHAPGSDFTTWDLPRLFTEIDRRFQKALAGEAILKSTPIVAWDDLLEKGSMPDGHRPTLYDFIVHEALEFFISGEQAAAKPEDVFEISADSPIFDTVDKFLTWQPETTDIESPKFKAVRLYQDLLRFHQNDPAPKLAYAAADLDRLKWGGNVADGESKNERYKAALTIFISQNTDQEISALAYEVEAHILQLEGDLVAAREWAARGERVFPNSPGGKLCRKLIDEIEAKSATISGERVWHAPWPKITVRYRNLSAVYFRAIPVDWEIFLEKRRNRPENLSENERREILGKAPALEWSAQLPPTRDFKEKTFDVDAPDTLKPGFYFIAVSHDSSFGEKENMVSMLDIWVSNLALITRNRGNSIEGLVLQADSGEPVNGAEISVWHLDNAGNRISDPLLKSDSNGFFSMKPVRNRGYLFRARFNGQDLAAMGDTWLYDWQMDQGRKPEALTKLFTDRAIYRPGQTIQYKGICLWVDQIKDNYEVLKQESLTVVFSDVNGKEIARQKHRASDYGSFAGSFTVPRDRLTGEMSIHTEGRASGSTEIRIEEYKRPKFGVTFAASKTAARLNDTVRMTGRAVGYTGAAVDGARVQYRVVRDVRMPWWWRREPQGQSQEIAHGALRTESDGSFKIEFAALPDRKVSEKDEPTFHFRISADVTDTAGETRSAEHSVRVGYVALEAGLSAIDWQTASKPVEIEVTTRALDGEPQAANGTVRVYALQAPANVARARLPSPVYARDRGWSNQESMPENDLSDPNNWPLGPVSSEQPFTSNTNGTAKLSFNLLPGAYRAVLETQDRFGKKVTAKLPVQVLSPNDPKLTIKIPHLFAAPAWEAQPGETFLALWGTGYDQGRAFVELDHRNRIVQRFWTKPGNTQQAITVPITEEMRGGFTVRITQIRDNRAYLETRSVMVPWKNKDLTVKWEHFTSKLLPGQKESWTVVITGPKAEKAAAEMVATLYDESLDAFTHHNWLNGFDVFREDDRVAQAQFGNVVRIFYHVLGGWSHPQQPVNLTYRHFPFYLVRDLWAERTIITRSAIGLTPLPGMQGGAAPMLPSLNSPASTMAVSASLTRGEEPNPAFVRSDQVRAPKPDLTQVTARENLNETAFFFPQLTSDSNGVVRITFTPPDALTRWRFMGFAHDRSVRSGYLEAHAVTSKDLMVQPNPPRFLREDDTVEFTVKVSNQSDVRQAGTVRLNFKSALNEAEADSALGNTKPDQDFEIAARESRSFAWRIHVPDGCGFLTYKAVAATATLSDGEEGAVPVLSRRVLVTESLPLPIRGPATNQFRFSKLLQSGQSQTLRNESLTVQMVSNPAWYAVLALPYLMEFPYECSEQTFNRLYANALARHIARSDPKIRRIFDLWKNTPALDSPLEKNEDLKSVLLEETPWLRQAHTESQARRNLGILFDDNRLDNETESVLTKLMQMQLTDGRWPWFPGGPGNDFLTLYIVTGFGRLRHLGVDLKVPSLVQVLQRLDARMLENYESIQKQDHPENYVPSATDALFLYGRSFFLKETPILPNAKPAIDFFLAQARKFWLATNGRQTQGQIALALHRWDRRDDNLAAARGIMKSLQERSVSSEEMGMFWRDTEFNGWWYRAPIETQALMIEAFDEVMNDRVSVEACGVWLLKQKQTQNWKTTKATADAVYALLLRGPKLLSSDALVQVQLGTVDVIPNPSQSQTSPPGPKASVEPGTGFYQHHFAAANIKPELGEIRVGKVDAGVAWGSVHWQYLEDMSKVTPSEGTPLKLAKALFVKNNTAKGPVLEPLRGEAHPGDELVVRIELRADRDLEYVHLKDQRGSGTEPVNVLSRYRYQDGLAYYESTRDTASHFFCDFLPKGTYVFEYSTRVQLRGEYQTGVAEIQCMYAPEFNSHSESIRLTVK